MVTRHIFPTASAAACAAIFLLLTAEPRIGTAQTSPAPSTATSTQLSSSPAGTEQAQQPATEQNASDSAAGNAEIPKIRVGTNEVNVVFTVTDKHGKRVTDLKQADFRIVDDSKPVTEIRSFHAETNLPLQVGLLIDASASVRDRFKFEQESAIEFLNQTIRKRYDQAFVVGFDVTPEAYAGFHRRHGKAGAWSPGAAPRRWDRDVRRALLRLPR